MAEKGSPSELSEASEDPHEKGGARSPRDPKPLPPEEKEALEKILKAGGPQALLSIFGAFSRTTYGGPDPETAKILADSEKHAEACRLKGYQSTLDQKDRQNVRDHEFRKKQLNHETTIRVIMVVACVGALIWGTLLSVRGNSLGGYILLAAFISLLKLVDGRVGPPRPSDR
jgi:hypothetical protein